MRIGGTTERLEPGDEVVLRADALDDTGTSLPGRTARWTSSDASVGRVDGAGVFTAIASGSTDVTADIDGTSASRRIVVSPPSISSLELDRASLSLDVGQRGTLSVTARSRTGARIEADDVAWSSDAPSVASVEDGQVTGAGPGRATITANAGGARASATVTVRVDTRTAIEELIAAYASALESKDIDAVRRAYPGMTRAQEDGLKGSLRSMDRAQLTVQSVQQDGATATAEVTGSYVLVDNGRRQAPLAVDLHATFERDASGNWRMTGLQ